MPVKAIPDGYPAVTPYLIVQGAVRAIEFYKGAFGATERLRMDMPGGKIGHAELELGGSLIMLADEVAEMNIRAPGAFGGSPVSLHLYVEDVDAAFNRAIGLGAKAVRPLQNQFYGDRSGMLLDPFGHTWNIASHVEDVAPEEIARRAAQQQGAEQASDKK